ncbi:MAG: hypothetical protein KGH82_02260 [Candidatus Micrarchaeota archaeon]|nr:hypothetical protein [Candidatus Micrarchaeota archaeon]
MKGSFILILIILIVLVGIAGYLKYHTSRNIPLTISINKTANTTSTTSLTMANFNVSNAKCLNKTTSFSLSPLSTMTNPSLTIYIFIGGGGEPTVENEVLAISKTITGTFQESKNYNITVTNPSNKSIVNRFAPNGNINICLNNACKVTYCYLQ